MLVEVTLSVIDRAVIQSVFGLRRRQAVELMHRFGGYQAGHAFLIERTRLISELDKIATSGEFHQEEVRHEKLTAALAKFQRARRAREIRIDVPSEVFDTRMSMLPNAVHLEPGKLEVEFSDCEDLLGKLFTLAQVAINDFDGFEEVSNGTDHGRR